MKILALVKRLFLATLLGGATALFALGSYAAQVPFEQKQLDATIASGKPVIVYFSATWCPTCKAQKPIVDELMKQPKFKDVTLFKADYDNEVALKKQMHITQQSTFVVFHSGKEVARSTGQTDKQVITQVFDKAL